jgi:hypothetical protein
MDDSNPGALAHVVVLCLANGDRVPVATCASRLEAEQRVARIIAELETDRTQGWPLFESTYVRPSAVVALEVVEERQRSWGGSTARSRWGSSEDTAAGSAA